MLTEPEKSYLDGAIGALLDIENGILVIASRDHNPHLYRTLVSIRTAIERIEKAIKDVNGSRA